MYGFAQSAVKREITPESSTMMAAGCIILCANCSEVFGTPQGTHNFLSYAFRFLKKNQLYPI